MCVFIQRVCLCMKGVLVRRVLLNIITAPDDREPASGQFKASARVWKPKAFTADIGRFMWPLRCTLPTTHPHSSFTNHHENIPFVFVTRLE